MRGLIMALFAIDWNGLPTGRSHAPARRTKLVAKTTTKTV